MIRMRLVVGLATLFIAAMGGVAQACIVQGASAGPAGGAPGDPVPPGGPVQWSITKLDPGATYTVSLGGQQVATGVADTGGTVNGTATMPDLGGSAQDVPFSVQVVHDDIDGGNAYLTSIVHYRPASAPATDRTRVAAPPPTSAAPVAETAPSSTRASAPTSAASPGPGSRGTHSRAKRKPSSGQSRDHARRPRTAHRTPVSSSKRVTQLAPRPAVAQAVPLATPAPTRVVVTRPATPRHRTKARAHHVTARAAARPLQASRLDRYTPTAIASVTAYANASPPPPAAAGPPIVLALALLTLLVLGAGGAFAVIRSRRTGPAPDLAAARPDPIEAELQELLAEEHAREFSAGLVRDEPG